LAWRWKQNQTLQMPTHPQHFAASFGSPKAITWLEYWPRYAVPREDPILHWSVALTAHFWCQKVRPGHYQLCGRLRDLPRSRRLLWLSGPGKLVDVVLTKTPGDCGRVNTTEPGISPAVAKAREAMQKRIDQLETELKSRNVWEREEAILADVGGQNVDRAPHILLATNTQAGKAQRPRPPAPLAPKEHVIPDALQAPESTTGVDNFHAVCGRRLYVAQRYSAQ